MHYAVGVYFCGYFPKFRAQTVLFRFHDFATFTNNSRTEQDVVSQKSALKATEKLLGASVVLWTLAH